jgi:hypothetical protein
MSDSSQKDAGTIQVLLTRLETVRLPRALELQKRVERGERLEESDTQFLSRVFEEARGALPLVTRHPELQPLISQLTSLYTQITSKALENEQKSS